MDFTEGLKKIFLAGVGAVAMTAEKTQDVVDDLVKKGELTVEQGKALNEELKHKKEEETRAREYSKAAVKQDFSEMLSHLSPEQLAELKRQLADTEKAAAEDAEEDAAEEAAAEEIEEELKD